MFGSNYLPRLLSLLVAIGLVGSLAMTTATAADNSISKADLVQRELPTFLGSLNLTINTTLQDVKPRLANVTTANLTTDCYEPGIVGLDNKFVVLDHTIAETIVYYFQTLPRIIDETNVRKRFQALLGSLYLIADHVADCGQKSQGSLGLTPLSAFQRDELPKSLN